MGRQRRNPLALGRRGYEVFAMLDDHPRGHQLYMLYKRLT
jgi:hypothetical protein